MLETFLYITGDEFVIILRAFDEFVTQGKLSSVIFARNHYIYLSHEFVIILRTFYKFVTQGKLNAMHLIVIFVRNPDAQHYIYLSHEFVFILRTFYKFVAQGKINA